MAQIIRNLLFLSLLLPAACGTGGDKQKDGESSSPDSSPGGVAEYVRQCKKIGEEYAGCVQVIDVSPSRSAAIFAADIAACGNNLQEKNQSLLKLLTAEELAAINEKERKSEVVSLSSRAAAECAAKKTFQEQRDCVADTVKSLGNLLCPAP